MKVLWERPAVSTAGEFVSTLVIRVRGFSAGRGVRGLFLVSGGGGTRLFELFTT